MVVKEFINHLEKLHFFLIVEKDRLILKGDRSLVSEEEISRIKQDEFVIGFIRTHKSELIEYLTSTQQNENHADNISAIYKLSPLQEGMLFHELYNRESGAYIEQMVFELSNIQTDAFEKSWYHVIRQHSILRSGFYYDAFKIPVQCVYKAVMLRVTMHDCRNMNPEQREARLLELEKDDRSRSFDLKVAPLMRITLIRLSEDQYRMLFTWHHILFDGWSVPVIFRTFLDHYTSILTGGNITEKKEDKFEDYIRFIDKQDKAKEENYWRNYLHYAEEATFLPFVAASDRTKKIGRHKKEVLCLGADILHDVETYVKMHHITTNTLMQGVWSYLLYHYSDSSHVCFGVTVSGRPEELPGVANRVGMYINTIPVHSFVDEKDRISPWLQKMQREQIEGRKYQYSSLKDIQSWTSVQGDLFDSVLTFQNYPINTVLSSFASQLNPRLVASHEHSLNYPLAVRIGIQDTISVEFLYKSDVIDEYYVKLIANHFRNVLLQIVSNRKETVGDIALITSQERDQLLDQFNPPKSIRPGEQTIVTAFEQQVVATPEQPAVYFDNKQISYAELNMRANQLAGYLLHKGVKPGNSVPLVAERSIEMIVGLLAITKAGGVYVPIDPGCPVERLRFILSDIQASHILLPGSHFLLSEIAGNYHVVDVQKEWAAISRLDSANQKMKPSPDDLAYIIYTSGSTGKPKGVMIEHMGLLNVCKDHIEEFSMGVRDRYLQFMSTAFDGSILDIFSTLLCGATLILPEKQTLTNRESFLKFTDERQITILTVTPTYLSMLDKAPLPTVRTIISAGEAANAEDVCYYATFKNFYNGYGPSEATINTTLFPVPPGKTLKVIPIGKPRLNKRVYIMAKGKSKLLPVGVPGEICIGGDGIARGYLNQATLTREKFLNDPFDNDASAILYRTGDLGRWLPDGNIEFLGRIDDQVKIRGYRIELQEIENILLQSEKVSYAVVLAKTDNQGSKRLIAYVVPAGVFVKEELTSFLEGCLPDYMIPAAILQMAELPVTANGKVDKKALPDPDMTLATNGSFVEPRNETETTIAAIWKDVLGIERVSIHDRFFDLGGDSIKVISVVSKLQKAFRKDILLQDVYESADLEHLAAIIDKHTGTEQPENPLHQEIKKKIASLKASVTSIHASPAEIEDAYPMSDIQCGMVYASLINPELGIYHDQMIYPPVRNFNRQIFEKALDLLVSRHPILRTAFDLSIQPDGVQIVYKTISFEIKYIDLEDCTEENCKSFIQNYFKNERAIPFELSKAPLWRFTALKLNEDHILLFQCHHAILDGWSVATLNTELNNLCIGLQSQEDKTLKPLACTYKDFIIESLAEKTKDQHSRLFWKEEMAGYKRLDIFSPDHFYDRCIENYGNSYLMLLSQKASYDGISLKALFLGAYAYVLSMLSYEDDLTLGMVTNTRPAIEDGEKLLGCFLNTIPFRYKVNRSDTWKNYFEAMESKVNYLKTPGRSTLFEIKKSVGEHPASENPFFDTLFNFVNFHVYDDLKGGLATNSSDINDAGLHQDYVGHDSTNTFLDCTVNVTYKQLSVSFTLQRRLKSNKSLGELQRYFKAVLDCYLNNYTSRIKREIIIPSNELQLLTGTRAGSSVSFPVHETIVSLFERQVSRTPDNCAVVFDDTMITYRELNQRANQLANYLTMQGISKESLVPLCLERNIEMIIGILAIVKAGAAYVPVDPDYPADRIAFVLDDCNPEVIIYDGSGNTDFFTERDCILINIREDWPEISSQPTGSCGVNVSPSNLAYIIYTSGSSGKPKGVMIEHRNVVRLFETETPLYAFGPDDVWTLFHSFCFDFSVWEMYGALFYGGRLVVVPKQVAKDFNVFSDLLVKEQVTILNQTPSAFYALQDTIIGSPKKLALRYVIFGGEALNPQKVKPWRNYCKDCRLINMYGITETTVHVTYQELTDDHLENSGSIIGRPIPTLSLFILDKNMMLLPVGVAGELYVGGAGLARAYLNRDDLTHEKFIIDTIDGRSERLYRTGDLGRWLTDGSVEYLGRIDSQVKIRGYRIELGEIENSLLQSTLVKQAVVIAQSDTGRDNRLIGYIVPIAEFDKEAILAFLKSKLPDYMIPSLLIEMKDLPLTANGKIDKKGLPSPDAAAVTSIYVEALTDTETKLAAIWKDLLGVEKVGVYDDFFELGGHSLLATKAITSLSIHFGVKLPIRVLFEFRNLKDLSKYIELKLLEDKNTIKQESAFEIVDIE